MPVFGKSLFIRFDNHSNEVPTYPPEKAILDGVGGVGGAGRAEESGKNAQRWGAGKAGAAATGWGS